MFLSLTNFVPILKHRLPLNCYQADVRHFIGRYLYGQIIVRFKLVL